MQNQVFRDYSKHTRTHARTHARTHTRTHTHTHTSILTIKSLIYTTLNGKPWDGPSRNVGCASVTHQYPNISFLLVFLARPTRHPHTAWQSMGCTGHGTNRTIGSASVTISVLCFFSPWVVCPGAQDTHTAWQSTRSAGHGTNRTIGSATVTTSVLCFFPSLCVVWPGPQDAYTQRGNPRDARGVEWAEPCCGAGSVRQLQEGAGAAAQLVVWGPEGVQDGQQSE